MEEGEAACRGVKSLRNAHSRRSLDFAQRIGLVIASLQQLSCLYQTNNFLPICLRRATHASLAIRRGLL